MKIKINTDIYAEFEDIAEARMCARIVDHVGPEAMFGVTAEQVIERAGRYDPRVRGAALEGLYPLLSAAEKARYRVIVTHELSKLD